MTQESELLYRSNLEGVCNFIKSKYGDERRLMMVKDVEGYTGLCYRTAKNKFFKKGSINITVENFARLLSKI